jgi:hypothetical protein
MLFSKSTAEPSQLKRKTEFSLERMRLAAQISGRPPMTIEEFVAKNRAAFL